MYADIVGCDADTSDTKHGMPPYEVAGGLSCTSDKKGLGPGAAEGVNCL